jgi:hypothetical protein
VRGGWSQSTAADTRCPDASGQYENLREPNNAGPGVLEQAVRVNAAALRGRTIRRRVLDARPRLVRLPAAGPGHDDERGLPPDRIP